MTQKEILDGNTLIAVFMGLRPKMISPDKYCWSDAPMFYTVNDTPEKVMDDIVEYAKYHTSWDWLMPVVIKINTMDDFRYSVNIYTMDVEIEDSLAQPARGIVASSTLDFVPDELLQSTFSCIVKFLNHIKSKV